MEDTNGCLSPEEVLERITDDEGTVLQYDLPEVDVDEEGDLSN